LIPGVNGVSDGAGIRTYWKNFEPRIGLAYKVKGSDKNRRARRLCYLP